VNRAEDKAAFNSANGMANFPTPAFPADSVRLGYSLLGAFNRPAPPEGTGLEAAKLSKKHMTEYYTYYLDQLQDAVGSEMGKGLQYMLTDSWEAGQANWPDAMIAEFNKRRGWRSRFRCPTGAHTTIHAASAS
jgi:hypothetical protein